MLILRLAGRLSVITLLIAVIAGCSAPADSTDTSAQAGAAKAASVAGISELAQGWNAFEPGGQTTCADGSAYKFFVRPGDPAKLMVFFQGGGGCWTRQTCDPEGQPTYTVNISAGYTPEPFGVFNFGNADNPFQDYSVVMAPYCTGDVHLGASDTVYAAEEDGQTPFTIHHQGRANAQAVLDWTYANVPDAQQIFVTGSSAGAIPSPFYAALIANQYPDAQVAHLGDGAGGYRRMNEDARPDKQWGTFNFLNTEAGFEQVSTEGFNYEKIYIAAAQAHPEILFAQYDAAEDAVQKRFLALSGTKDIALMQALQANHADIQAMTPNFRSFIAGGRSHTILRRPEFYSYGANGASIRDWTAELAAYNPVTDIACIACENDTYAGEPMPPAMRQLWNMWEDRQQQYVEPFKIFDNIYYVGIDWVAAYIIDTGDGLILIDSLYGKWVRTLANNIRQVGLDPADIKYIIATHGHFDHAGGNAYFQNLSGARIVMTEEDWQMVQAKPDSPAFYMPVPQRDMVAEDGDVIELGDNKIELFKTPGHTEGVLTLRYSVKDGQNIYTAVTLGGVGLNFSGVERTETYLESYRRLQTLQQGVSVSLPNHAGMAGVFERAAALAQRLPGAPHPFVDAAAYQAGLRTFITNAEEKLIAEKNGTAKDPMAELTKLLSAE